MRSLRFGDFVLDEESRQLLRRGEAVSLEPRARALLTLLLSKRPRALSKEQIRDVLWPGTFVSESALARLVADLRSALGDDARQPRFIRTLHGFGYAFCGVAEAEESSAAPALAGREPNPYPGLSAFTEADAERFFGRETEVASLLRKLEERRLLALIGPSGAGKTSLLRAGLVPSLPQAWGAVSFRPGGKPFVALARALMPDLAGDPEALRGLLGLDEPDLAVSVVGRWRQQRARALLIVDQFEELFTQTPPETQARVAELLGRLASEMDVHVLLSIRDDFLLRCAEHEALSPVFRDLTPLVPPSSTALRRAIVEPATRLGFSFEDDALVEEMVRAVGQERGTLPLLAFAVSRLWEERDTERELLTREAFDRLGGVAGALAGHAEATLLEIGLERERLLREAFRNLVTAEGTRAAMGREELLSVIAAGAEVTAREEAERVLDVLIAARLLTEYGREEAPGGFEAHGATAEARVEIVHESLLEAWPRLVQWRAQDQEGTVLRDQLRQAARLWGERGRTDDLLWTGTSYRELQLWRERYAGGLTSLEEEFADGMVRQAGRARRRRRALLAVAFAALAAVTGVIGALWRQSEIERDHAASEALRAEASRLVLLGRTALDDERSVSLAYALKSLELADTPEARRFALEVLWRGPTRLQLTDEDHSGAAFSPDGRWLALWDDGPWRLDVWSREGGPPKRFPGESSAAFGVSPDAGPVMVSRPAPDGKGGEHRVLIRSLRDWRLLRSLELPALFGFYVPPGRPELVTMTGLSRGASWFRVQMQAWPLVGGGPTELVQLDSRHVRLVGVASDPAGTFFAYGTHDDTIEAVEWRPGAEAEPRLVGRHVAPLSRMGRSIQVHPDGDTIVSADEGGEIRFHRRSSARPVPVRIVEVPGVSDFGRPQFAPDGSRMAVGLANDLGLWDLGGPPDAEPVLLRNAAQQLNASGFSPDGRWLVTVQGARTSLWPVARSYPRVLRGHTAIVTGLAFDPHGRWIATSSLDNTVRLWPLSGSSPERARVLFRDESGSGLTDIDVDPDGRFLLTANQRSGVWVIPVDGGAPRVLSGFRGQVAGVAFGPKGRLVAATGGQWEARDRVVRVWDLDSDEVRVLDSGQNKGMDWWFEFTTDGRILATEVGVGVRLWNVEEGTSEILHPGADRLTRGPRQSTVCTGRAERLEEWLCHDLATGATQAVDLSSHAGAEPGEFALDRSGRWFLSGDRLGVVRVGRLAGGPPHLLLGEKTPVTDLEVSPDGKWLAAGAVGGSVRLWPMPEPGSPPFHLLPHGELLDRLRALASLRCVEDEASASGYRIAAAAFPGWESVPTW